MRAAAVFLFFSVFTSNVVMAQTVVKLYPGAIPGAKAVPAGYKEVSETGQDGIERVSKVSEPTLTVYLPAKEKATGAGVIVCPGGGYSILAIGHEGYAVAKRLNEAGIAAFVLKYRLPADEIMVDKSFGPLQDAQQAIYQVRKDASKYGVNPAKIGIMGFSAGGHLASSLTVHYGDVKIQNPEKISLRPDFSILMYPVISFLNSPHVGSAVKLLGNSLPEAQKAYFSNETGVTAQTPPTFLVHANDDSVVPVANSIAFNEALVAKKVPVETHLYQSGGHGFGLNNRTTKDQWFDHLQNWLQSNHFID
jgi:acetyl esterase/lipase